MRDKAFDETKSDFVLGLVFECFPSVRMLLLVFTDPCLGFRLVNVKGGNMTSFRSNIYSNFDYFQ